MSDLDEIIQFRATFDKCFRKCGSVDSCVGSDLNIVFNDDGSDLWDLMVAIAHGCESEAVTTDNGTTVDNHSVSDGYLFSDINVRIDKSIGTDFRAFADINEGLNDGVVSDFNVVSDVGKRLD